MAINSHESLSEKIIPASTSKSSFSKVSNLSSFRLTKIDGAANTITDKNSKHYEFKATKNPSPYFTEDGFQFISKTTEKRLIHNNTNNFVSSFPLAVNIYKANSDQLKTLKKRSKKIKKSVLTLPNEPALLPQTYTVSDMNDSEYFNDIKNENKPKAKKRRSTLSSRKPRIKGKGIEIFDKDARYCSTLNIDLDISSTDMINQFTGDGEKASKQRLNNKPSKTNVEGHNVWAMLRNMNRFQFKPSPSLSQDSVLPIKKRKKYNKRRNNQVDTKFIETCRTEQFTYISSMVDETPRNSQSSIDCVTVIDKQDEYQELCDAQKVVNNEIRSKEKSKKVIKPYSDNKPNTRVKKNNIYMTCNERESDEMFHHNNVNQKLGHNLKCKSLQNNVQSQENKFILKNDACNNTNLQYTNRCILDQNNIKVSKKINEKSTECEKKVLVCGNSDSSNGDIKKNMTDGDRNKMYKQSLSESQREINGITKVVLSKGQNILLTKHAESMRRKPRLVTTMPSGVLTPKLTQTEIRRQLAKIKFPLIILSDEEVQSMVPVTDYEPPQFAGLDIHIWPFMQNWQKVDNFSNCKGKNNQIYDKNTQGMKGDYVAELKNNNIEMKIKKRIITDNNNLIYNDKRKNSVALRDKNTFQSVSKIENMNIEVPKDKPMRQFKDKMLQFLYKKSPFDVTKQRKVSKNLIDASTNTDNGVGYSIEQDTILCKKEGKMFKQITSNVIQPWAKGKWASDFIDNVIMKIKSGVYYNQDKKELPRNQYYITKENSVQTEMDFAKNEYCQNCRNQKTNSLLAINKERNYLQSIPGFDESLSDIQIESTNKNQIAIKHSVNNIILQFDVALRSETDRIVYLKQSVSFIPVTVTESQTKIYKSKTAIINAMLPAELCSILPYIMRKIIDNELVLPKIVDKVEPHLSTVAEFTRCESEDSLKHMIPFYIDASPQLRILRQGKFSQNVLATAFKHISENITDNSYRKLHSSILTDFLPNINTNLLFNCQIDQIGLYIFDSKQSRKPLLENYTQHSIKSCMELQPYRLTDKQIVPADSFNYTWNKNFNIHFGTKPTDELCAVFNKTNMIMSVAVDHQIKVGCIICEFVYNDFQGRFKYCEKLPSMSNSYLNQQPNAVDICSNRSLTNKIKSFKSGEGHNNIKTKKRSFNKYYKKCTSNMSHEKSSIAISKIKSLDDFFLALGFAKTLASVFDRITERTVLASVKEMKNWITEITPTQALLVLLLVNKKPTLNLVHYRSVILQGIAVNRITRASELDMEIEVIERENLHTFSEYEGISYLPASVENRDTLLEELCWIAKTTASDYQRPFDESSKRLLKSLLEKRKKLNPSYLRVMARYVGLGLLKSSK